MKPISYIITGLPRSGTLYTQTLFTTLNLACTHERWFNNHKQLYHARCRRENEGGAWGDVSWMAVPFLGNLDPKTVVLHQTRNHIDVLNSLYGWEDDGFRGGPCNSTQANHSSGKFVRKHCPDIFKHESEYVRILEFYLDWYARAEKYAVLTYDIAELQDPYFVSGLINFTHACGTRPIEMIKEAIAAVPTDRHHRGPTVQWAAEFLDTHPEYKERIYELR
jgi:hypothetical protein